MEVLQMQITYLGHSGFMIKCSSHAIAIDPFLSGNPKSKNTIDDVKVSDIFVSHGHGDHIGDAIKIAKKHNATITAIFELANYCERYDVKTNGINIGGKIKFDWGSVVSVPSTHSSSTPEGHYAGQACGFIINIGGNIIYHAGDTGLTYELKMIKEVYKPEIALLPIGDYYTMGIDEAIIAANWLNVKHVIPMHYNTFPPIQVDPNIFAKRLKEENNISCTILEPGMTKDFESACKLN